MKYNLENQLKINGDHYLENSVLWYILPFYENYYLSLSIHDRINFKDSYYR